MTLVVGADEAGYGPNLGPLVVAATVWEVDAPTTVADGLLDAALAAALAAAADGGRPLRWADSKRVHRGGAGLRDLEMAALAGVALAAGRTPTTWRELVGVLGAAQAAVPVPEAAARERLCVPLSAPADDGSRAAVVGRVLAGHGVRLAAIRCRIVDPGEFNALLGTGLNKSDLLSRATLELVAAEAATAPAVVCCDRHGGRKRYAPLVARHFGTPLVRVEEEGTTRSAYTLPELQGRIEFRVRAESRTPVALASLVAKYLRELAMHAFNHHWQSVMPDLRPTAGYPVDALRWRGEAAAAVARAGVAWSDVWRQA